MGERVPKRMRLKCDPRITVEFTGPNQTEDAGALLIRELMDSIGWEELLRQHVCFERNPWGLGYTTGQMLTQVVQTIALSARRPEHVEEVRSDETLRLLLGVQSLASADTILRFLREVTAEGLEEIRALAAAVRTRLLCRWKGRLDLDPDGMVVELYGKQEGAVRGYNPEHPGKRSYFPLVVTSPGPDLVMGQKLRPGNSGARVGDVELLERIHAQLPPKFRRHVGVRADAGHWSADLADWCERPDVRWRYAIKVRQTPPLMACVAGVRWEADRLNGEAVQFGELRYGPKQRRMVLMRRPRRVRDQQGQLFEEETYEYQVIQTTFGWTPRKVFEYYNDRGTAETQHDDLLEMGYGLGVTGEFAPNEVWSELVALAYNLLSALRGQIGRRAGVKPKVRTFRDRFLKVAAVVMRHARSVWVRLKEGWTRQPEFGDLLAYAGRGP